MFRWLPLVFQRPSLCARRLSLCAQWPSLCALCLCGAFSFSSRGQGADSRQTPRLPPLPALAALLAFLTFLPATLWWFLAQRGSREGQFPPFSLLPSLLRLARQGAGAVLGGLPLYAEGGLSLALAAGLSLILLALAAWIVWRWSRIGTPRARTLFGLAAMAPALGLLVLGVLFNNTPIEVRYLAFSTPFVALLLAGALPPPGRAGLLIVMAASIAGLMLAPQTMQPMRAAARAAAALMGNAPGRNGPREEGVVLLPRGNDGVGVVGAFAIESPPAQYLLVIAAGETPEHIRARLRLHRRVALALLEQDAASRAASEAMRDALTHPSWREVARSGLIAVYERTGGAAARFTEPHDRREHEHR